MILLLGLLLTASAAVAKLVDVQARDKHGKEKQEFEFAVMNFESLLISSWFSFSDGSNNSAWIQHISSVIYVSRRGIGTAFI